MALNCHLGGLGWIGGFFFKGLLSISSFTPFLNVSCIYLIIYQMYYGNT
jgi:hypothetical protein